MLAGYAGQRTVARSLPMASTAPKAEGTWQMTATSVVDPAAVAKALVIVAATPVISITRLAQCRDLGAVYLDHIARAVTEKRLVGRLESLGYRVTLET